MPGTDGLLHVSEIANHRVKDVRDELKEGEQVLVKVINIDPTGKIRLSRKALLAPEEGQAPARAKADRRAVTVANDASVTARRRSGPRPGANRRSPRSGAGPERLTAEAGATVCRVAV